MIDKICFVTGNQTKVLHAQVALKPFGITVSSQKLEIIEPKEEEPKLVVKEKALQAIKILKIPLMVEDSGIFIDALNGFPKTFIHFVGSTIGMRNIIKMMEGVENRRVEFRQSLAYIEQGMKEPKIFSYVDGGYTLTDRVWIPKYKDTGEFDKILIPPGETQPLCTFTKKWRAERDAIQNKGTIHYEQLANWLKSRN